MYFTASIRVKFAMGVLHKPSVYTIKKGLSILECIPATMILKFSLVSDGVEVHISLSTSGDQ